MESFAEILRKIAEIRFGANFQQNGNILLLCIQYATDGSIQLFAVDP